MSGRSIIIVGIIGIILLLIVGTAVSMSTGAPSSGLASVSNTNAWYGTNGQLVSGQPQYLSVVPGQYVIGEQGQAAQQLPPPQTQVQYVTVPAPVIVGSIGNDSDNTDTNASTYTPARSNRTTTVNYSNTNASYTAPYPTFADYEAQYYARTGYSSYGPSYSAYNYPAYGNNPYSTYPPAPPIPQYPQAYNPPAPQYPPAYGNPSANTPPYETFVEYRARYRQF